MWLDETLYSLGRPVVNLAAAAMFDMDVVQHAPLPDGPKIIAPNHPSTTDPFMIVTLPSDQTSILIDERLFKVPLFGRYLAAAGHVPVVRGNGRAAFEAARELLEAGQSVTIFPEGAISPLDGGFHRPRTGVARLALLTGAPVVPVGIHLDRERIRLTETIIEDKAAVGTWYLGGPYGMTVGEAMRFEGDVEDRERVVSISESIMQRIIQLSGESAHRMAISQVPMPLGSGRLANA